MTPKPTKVSGRALAAHLGRVSEAHAKAHAKAHQEAAQMAATLKAVQALTSEGGDSAVTETQQPPHP